MIHRHLEEINSIYLWKASWRPHLKVWVVKKRMDNFQKFNFSSENSELVHKAKIVNATLFKPPDAWQDVKSYCINSCTSPFPFFLVFWRHFIVIVVCSIRGNEDCVVVYEKPTLPETMLFSLLHPWIWNSSWNGARWVSVLHAFQRPVQSCKPLFVT